MRVEAETKQTIVSSQVVKWKLEVTKEMWDSDEQIWLTIPGKEPGDPRNRTDQLNWLRLSPWEDEKSGEKFQHFINYLAQNSAPFISPD